LLKSQGRQRLLGKVKRPSVSKGARIVVASVETIKKKLKRGERLGASEKAQAKARGLIARSDGKKRKSAKYKGK
jgi:hypothetical protein